MAKRRVKLKDLIIILALVAYTIAIILWAYVLSR